ncbi:ABC-2 type transport system permease protein [Anaerosolibacter carboniphilus]|uniref:ABC-2 type transport system permease protein n=1 Tax=Anaerosolibacter carboniphilus TaxID=1417629 RepID=A0A841KXC4_9FIRM|nr:ABC transporter permease subunit [Anaerosolibacter carboniphilus]MBB6218366.1 ABC-2 type transport system permease protein [Anaerosolibacter carboniphilus]
MKAIYLKELRLTRKMLIIWLSLIVILTGFAAVEFVMLKDALADIAELAGSFPKIVLVLFGMNGVGVDTALGAYQCMAFWSNLLAYFFAGFLGVFAVAREEKFGTSEFLFSKPYKRSSIVWAKIWAAVTNLAIFSLTVGIMSYLCIILPLGDMSIIGTHIITTIGMFITQIVLFAIGLLISSMAKNYKTASRLTMVAVMVFYVISFALDYVGTMNFLNFLTPIRYFEVVSVSANGLNPLYIILSLVIILSSCFEASRRYTGKDLRAL